MESERGTGAPAGLENQWSCKRQGFDSSSLRC